MLQIKVTQTIKTRVLCSVTFYRKSCRLWDNVENFGRAREATNDNIAHARCILDKQGYTRAPTHTHTEKYVILLYDGNNGLASAPECYVIRTLPALFKFRFWVHAAGQPPHPKSAPGGYGFVRGNSCLHLQEVRRNQTPYSKVWWSHANLQFMEARVTALRQVRNFRKVEKRPINNLRTKLKVKTSWFWKITVMPCVISFYLRSMSHLFFNSSHACIPSRDVLVSHQGYQYGAVSPTTEPQTKQKQSLTPYKPRIYLPVNLSRAHYTSRIGLFHKPT
jgi:hypothetical protein